MTLLDRTHPWPVPRSNGSDNRSPANYLAVLKQFDFDTSARYQAANGETYCNVAVADASLAFCAFFPHWWDKLDGTYGEQEYTINNSIDWLSKGGVSYGWTKVPVDDAKVAASLGKPTLVTWKNPAGHGHVAFVEPSWTLAQAGLVSGYGLAFTQVFTQAMMPQLSFWCHA